MNNSCENMLSTYHQISFVHYVLQGSVIEELVSIFDGDKAPLQQLFLGMSSAQTHLISYLSSKLNPIDASSTPSRQQAKPFLDLAQESVES